MDNVKKRLKNRKTVNERQLLIIIKNAIIENNLCIGKILNKKENKVYELVKIDESNYVYFEPINSYDSGNYSYTILTKEKNNKVVVTESNIIPKTIKITRTLKK